jgi:hypothetical protein
MATSEADVRGLCGILDCENRADILMAWPKRWPVPVCQSHSDVIKYQVDKGSMTPDQWLEWLVSHAKPHILPPVRPSK